MGDLIVLINEIKFINKNSFCILMDKMQPLINKYTYLLYKDEKEDVQSELYIALLEAVNRISILENDGEVINYFAAAIRHRFLELYRASKKIATTNLLLKMTSILMFLLFINMNMMIWLQLKI